MVYKYCMNNEKTFQIAKTIPTCINFTESTKKRMALFKAQYGISLSNICEEAVNEYISNRTEIPSQQ